MNNISIKKKNINNSIINNITKNNTINNNENVLNVKKDYPYKTYVSNNYKSHIGYVENNIYIYIYKKQDNRTFNNTNTIYKHINQYSTDVFNNYKINKTRNVKKTHYNYNTMFLLISITPLTLMIHTI